MVEDSTSRPESALSKAITKRRIKLTEKFVGRFGHTVQSGPFADMVLSARVSWGDGDLLPKLIGSYELELHDTVAQCVERQPDLVVNVGAAEGYYAVGLARLLPHARVLAYDTAPLAQEICLETARLNGVEGRITIGGACTPETLQRNLVSSTNALVVCDAEGYERVLIDPGQIPGLARAAVVVECHDFMDPRITLTLVDRLKATHDVLVIFEGSRDPNTCEFLTTRDSFDRWLAVCEFRPSTMNWIVGVPK